MKILNFGSLNLDLVYQIPHFVRAGETLSTTGFSRNVGGKGLNQSVALAKAGAEVYHAGLIGEDGAMLKDFLAANGVDTRFVRTLNCPSGHAVIQVVPEGNNCIFLYGGANQMVSEAFIAEALEPFGPGDFLVLQNEINMIDKIILAAAEKGMQVVLNPSPIADNLKELPLEKISWFILNEIEGGELSGENEADKILDKLTALYPHAKIVLTLGGDGSVYADSQRRVKQAAYKVQAVDTTAAGDTFTGFFFAAMAEGAAPEDALRRASKASSISVTRPGAAASIPTLSEVLEALG
ncbi:MAG: ribokinase [Clostridia bacterium]|nr:ribokinase [Clostridia bacterium]